MKIPAATLVFCVLAYVHDADASNSLQRKRSGKERDPARKLAFDSKFTGDEDQALWERILQDTGMSLPPTGKLSVVNYTVHPPTVDTVLAENWHARMYTC